MRNKSIVYTKKVLTVVGKTLLAVLILLILFLLTVFVYNRIMLEKEKPLLDAPLGEMIEADGHSMCLYTIGEGEHTLVFLSGSGTASPILDFRSLYSLLYNDNKIAVIEKFGYGFSDTVDTERSFDTILRQDREALSKSGINAPYILCPHSMSGLEALLWAQRYPGEVEAIIGLDMSLPRAYDSFDFNAAERFEKLAALGRELGLVRFFYSDSYLPQMLSKDEKALYRAIACKKAVNEAVVNEGLAIPDAVKEIDSAVKPDVPMLMFVSDGKETGIKNWADIQKAYASDLSNARVIELECGHYVHNFEQERISGYIREFIEGLN